MQIEFDGVGPFCYRGSSPFWGTKSRRRDKQTRQTKGALYIYSIHIQTENGNNKELSINTPVLLTKTVEKLLKEGKKVSEISEKYEITRQGAFHHIDKLKFVVKNIIQQPKIVLTVNIEFIDFYSISLYNFKECLFL